MSPAELIARARRSAASAKLLFDAGDINGACNRAYYAMFDAARAALVAGDESVRSEAIKTHSGLIAAFSLHVIKPGLIPAQYGKSLRQVDQIRVIADYSDEEVDRERGLSVIGQGDQFIEAVGSYVGGLPVRFR
ncbi:MAG TPA: HEPN domain-containing protein [Steroidobacteraceae bacterium]|nr:HEPN domain-containing protein [Steroidobacteraceae bacterium]